MKKFFKKLGKGCGYVVLYLLVAIGTAAGILFLSPAGNTNVSASQIPVQLQQLWQNLQIEDAIFINLDAQIESGESTTYISANLKLDLSNGEAQLNAQVDVGKENFDLNLFYGNGEVFLEALNGKFKMQTNSIGDTISKITSLLGVDLPDLGGIDLSTLDADMILGFLSDLKETKNQDGINLAINISMLDPAIHFDVLCDNDYNLKKIEIPQMDLGGTSFSLSANVNYPEKIELKAPKEENYIDISELMDMASVALGTLQTDVIGFDVNVTLQDGRTLQGNFNGDLKNLKASFETELLDLPLKISVTKSKTFYLEFGNIYVRFGFSDVDKLNYFLEQQFGISVPVEEITQILSAIQEKEFMKILPALSFGSEPTSVDSIDLSVLEGLSYENDQYVITLRGIGQITMATEEGAMKSLAFEGLGVSAKVEIVPAKEVKISYRDSADLVDLLRVANAAMNTLKQDVICGRAEIMLEGTPIVVDFSFDKETKQLDLQIALKPDIFDTWAIVRYCNKKLYVTNLKNMASNIDGVWFDEEQTKFLINALAPAFSGQDKDEAIEKIKSLLDPQTYENFFTNIENNETKLTVELLEQALVDFDFEEKFVNDEYVEFLKILEIKFESLEASIQFGVEPNFIDVHEEKYENVEAIANNISNAVEYAKAGKYYVSLEADFGDITTCGFADYDEKGLSAELNLFVFGQNVKIRVFDNEIFLDIKDLHFKTNLKNWKELLAVVSEEFDVSFDEFYENLDKIKQLLDGKIQLDISALLESKTLANILSKLWIEIENGNLKVTYDNIIANLNFLSDKSFALEIFCGDSTATLSTKTEKSQLTPFDDADYVEVSEVLRKAGAVLDYVQGGQYYVTLSGGYDSLVSFDGALNFDTNGLKAELNVLAYGQTAKIRVFGSKIYLDLKDVHLCADLKDWKTLLGVVSEEFGIDFDVLLGKVNLNVETLEKVLSGTEKFDFKKLTSGMDIKGILNKLELSYAKDKLSITFGDAQANVIFVGDMISEADVSYAGVSAKLEIKDKANVITELDQDTTYSEVGEVLRKAGAVLDYVQVGQYYVTLSGGYDSLVSFEGALNFDTDGLKAELNVSAYGQTAKIRVFGSKVYVDVKDVHLQADISNWREILDLIESSFGLNFEELDKTLDKTKVEFSKEKIEELLEKVGLSYEDGKVVLHYSGLTATVNFGADNMISVADIAYDKLSATVTIKSQAEKISELGETVYEPIENIISKAANVYDYVTNKDFHFNNINFTIDNKYSILGFVNFDRTNGLSASLSTSIDGVDISAKILENVIYLKIANLNLKFEIADIETVLYFLRDEFKLDFVDAYKEYKWIVDMLMIDKDINFNKLTSLGDGKSFDIEGTLKKLGLAIEGDVLSATFQNPNLSAEVKFVGDKLSTISLEVDKFKFSADLQGKQTVSLGEETYFDLVDILPVVTSIKNYVLGKKFDITANAKVFEGETQIYDAKNIILQVDATEKLQFFADAHVAGMENTKSAGFDLKLNAAIFQNYLYFDYNGLCLKLSTENLQDILAIVCDMIGIDPSILSIITGKQSESSGIDLSSMGGLVTKLLPGVDTSNKLGLLNIIKEFSMNGNVFDIALDGSVISNSEGAENMHLQIVMGEFGDLEKIVIKNLYTGVTSNEHFNLEINFDVLETMKTPDTSKNYIDLTGAEDLIKALINTISHKTFELTGNLKVNFGLKIPGLGWLIKPFNNGSDVINIDWDIPVVIQMKLSNGKPEVYAEIGPIPVPLGGVINNDTPLTGMSGDRMLHIYYYDGLVYFYRYETNTKGQTFEKRLNSHLDTVMNDVLYYVQWGTGFIEQIMDAIRKSLSIEHDVDLGNIIQSFTSNNPNYELTLNMEEITGDKNMGAMSVGVGITTLPKLDDQKVVGNLTLNMEMPFADSAKLYLKTNNPDGSQNLYLELDKNLDEDFKTHHSSNVGAKYLKNENEYVEFMVDSLYEATDGKWGDPSEREFTITFETGRSEITENAVKGVKGAAFNLPNYTQTFEDVVHDESGAEIEKTKYYFAGWYTDPNFATGTEFKDGIIPNLNLTLYGKWDMDSSASWRTVTYYDSDKTFKAKQYLKIGAELDQNVEDLGIKRRKNENDGFEYAVKFVGWTDEFGGEFTHVPSYSISLYAHFEKDDGTSKHTLSFDTGFGPTLESVQYYSNWDIREQGYVTAFDTYGKENEGTYQSGDRVYKFEGWFLDQEFEEEFGYIIPANDITIYAKWTEITEWKLQIFDNGVGLLHDENGGDLYLKKGTKILPYEAGRVAGEGEFMLPQSVKIVNKEDEPTLWYADAEYQTQTDLPNVMTNGDLELHLRNKYDVTYTYRANENGSWTTKTYSAKHYQGEKITLMAQENYFIDHQENGHNSYRMNYDFGGYMIAGQNYGSQAQYVVPNQDISFETNYTERRQNYYLIEFVLEAYAVYGYVVGVYETAPQPIAAEWVLDGTKIDLTQSKYQVTCVMYTEHFVVDFNPIKFQSTTWGDKSWKEYSITDRAGGSGFTSYTVDGHNQKLYACWKKV